MYIKAKDNTVLKFPYSFQDLRKENPGVSFSSNIDEKTLAKFSVYTVIKSSVPEFNSKTHQVKQTVELIDGKWTQVWQLKELPEIQASSNIRGERNRLLAECDWTQLEDSPLNADSKLAWSLYRETLRMIPQQAGFPYNVTWPPKPQ